MKNNFMKSIIRTLSFNKKAISIVMVLCIISIGSILISSYHKNSHITANSLSAKPKPNSKLNKSSENKKLKTQITKASLKEQFQPSVEPKEKKQSTKLYSNKINFINKLPLKNSSQAVIVETPSEASTIIKLKAYEKDNSNAWHLKFITNGVVGVKGISLNKKEGDLKTPEGIFSFLFEFGSAPSPGTKMEYRQIHNGDYWCSVPNAKEYNTLVTYKGKSSPDSYFGHGNYQNLYTNKCYKYAAAINYNYGTNKTIGNGSAVFLHIQPPNGGGTPGCVGIPENTLVQILQWMNPSKNPRIVIGSTHYLSTF
ncbi:L,D-transpeptidase family protein [Clostridium felsineum]|uniref:L,D-transpeptidase family protein n=1 Tax=Clostridium felsineum TaxID=36839 RepID=UPI00214DB47B|nr:L,D-transpeptidase family protein [Clostridium felsineum]MCR3760489.1 L,D-transpeptidase family protein [Clostridium felsineum]